MSENILNNYGDIVYSCLIPHDTDWEHRRPDHSIIFVRSGKLLIEDHGESLTVEAGNYVFIRRNCTVNITKMSIGEIPYRGVLIILQRAKLKEYYARLTQGSNKLPRDVKAIAEAAKILPHSAAVEGLFSSLLPYIDMNEHPSDEMLALKLQEAIMALLATDRRFYPTLFDFNETWKIDILDFLEQNFTEDMTLEEFASYTGRSLATFKRDFAKISNTTPQRWITDHRLERAHQLLASHTLSATEVAYRVGFKNRSHFSSAFKHRFGYAPSEVAAN